MDGIQFLKQEHEKAKGMFQQIEGAGQPERGQLWKRLAPELKLHEQIEEKCLYDPVAKAAGSRDATLRDWEQRHHREVGEAEAMIARIDGRNPYDDRWLNDVKELRATLEKHIQQEEGDIWPRIRQVWDEKRLEEAGRQMEEMAREHKRAA